MCVYVCVLVEPCLHLLLASSQVGEDPLNRSEVAELHAELRSPVFMAEVASRARSPQLLRPTNKTDHVADILTLDRPGQVVHLVSYLLLMMSCPAGELFMRA